VVIAVPSLPSNPFAPPSIAKSAPAALVPAARAVTARAPVPQVTRSVSNPVARGSTRTVPPPNLFVSSREKPKPGQSVMGELRYWLLALALIPLAAALFRQDDKIEDRIASTLRQMSPDEQSKFQRILKFGDDDENDERLLFILLAITPDHRIDGAHLPRDTHVHWLYAMVSAGFFWGIIVLLFPLGNSKPRDLLLNGLFTGTIGILFLLMVQKLAFATSGFWIGGGVIGIFLLVLKIIALAYHSALDPSAGFVASLLGYTFGVGMCEEFCKGMVLFWRFKRGSALDWRGACVWGLASGVGFGVSEGIMYSGAMYNGICRYDIYLIRFISCVALHSIWSAAMGLSAYRNRSGLQATWKTVLKIIFVPMVLHGIYDTLLKKDYPGGAVLAALCSFAWLAYQFECTYAENGVPGAEEATA
jgi:RsiW-degrading membrane proteinase PrsW (M82 family)